MFTKILSEKVAAFYAEHASDKKTLDVGSRRGRHKEHFPNVYSIDLDAANDPDQVADAHALPFPDNSYDVVICREVLEHVENPFVVMGELYRVLAPGGTLLLSTRFIFPIHEAPNDHWRFTRYSLANLSKNFTNVRIEEDTAPSSAVGCLIQRFAWQSDFRYCNRLSKLLLLILAEIFLRTDGLVKAQYGNITKTEKVDSAFSNGYFLVATK
jgi:2-polyprenyl-3-methyl-5-hydroxy-6-metoxy-1,4-benzoquinol methylase